MPSRLLKAFPAGVPIHRLPLEEAIARVEMRLTSVSNRIPEPVK